MNVDEILNTGIGNKDKISNSLKPSKVVVVAVKVQEKKKNGEDLQVPLIQFEVKHPDAAEHIIISKVKQLSGEKVYCSSTWYTTDEDNKIQKDMPLSRLLNHAGALSIAEMVGKEINTIEESKDSHFLVFKAY